MKCILRFALFTIVLVLFTPVAADTDDDGVKAFDDRECVTAHRIWQPLAETGNTKPQAGLSLKYDLGQGVTQDYQKALKWYRLAAEQGHAGAQFNLGLMYDLGQGITQDYQWALKWYRLAAKQGHAEAQFKLGLMYDLGQGVTQDYQ